MSARAELEVFVVEQSITVTGRPQNSKRRITVYYQQHTNKDFIVYSLYPIFINQT